MTRTPPPKRGDYRYFVSIGTRWMDNDLYGHVNNVVYYSYFDTVIASFLMQEAKLDPWQDPIIGIAVENGCRFHASLAFPDRIDGGLRVAHLGNSSVRYEIGIFRDDSDIAAADGHFVHVFVTKHDQKPTPIPEPIRTALRELVTAT
ncbi:MAG: thioesterase family protein [Pseudomonadota bacterium]